MTSKSTKQMSGNETTDINISYTDVDVNNLTLSRKGRGNKFGNFHSYSYKIGKKSKIPNIMVRDAHAIIFKPQYGDGEMHPPGEDPDWAKVKDVIFNVSLGQAENYEDDPLYQHLCGVDEETARQVASNCENNEFQLPGDTVEENMKILKGKDKYLWGHYKRLVKFSSEKKNNKKVVNLKYGPTFQLKASLTSENGGSRIYNNNVHLFSQNKTEVPFTRENIDKFLTPGTMITFVCRYSVFASSKTVSSRATPIQIVFRKSSQIPKDVCLLVDDEVEENADNNLNGDDYDDDSVVDDKEDETSSQDSDDKEDETSSQDEEKDDDNVNLSDSDSDSDSDIEEQPKTKVVRRRTTKSQKD